MAVGMKKGGHVQEMAGLKVHWVELMGGWTGWRKDIEEDVVFRVAEDGSRSDSLTLLCNGINSF